MEYAALLFLETEEVNAVHCSAQKPDPACALPGSTSFTEPRAARGPKAAPRKEAALGSRAQPAAEQNAEAQL